MKKNPVQDGDQRAGAPKSRGQLVCELRQRCGLSREELGRRADVSERQLYSIEHDGPGVGETSLGKTIRALDRCLREKLSGEELAAALRICEQVLQIPSPLRSGKRLPRRFYPAIAGAVTVIAVAMAVPLVRVPERHVGFDGRFDCDPGMSAEAVGDGTFKLTRTGETDTGCLFLTSQPTWFPLDRYREVEIQPVASSDRTYWNATFRYQDAAGADLDGEPRLFALDSATLEPKLGDARSAPGRSPAAMQFAPKVRVMHQPGRSPFVIFRVIVR